MVSGPGMYVYIVKGGRDLIQCVSFYIPMCSGVRGTQAASVTVTVRHSRILGYCWACLLGYGFRVTSRSASDEKESDLGSRKVKISTEQDFCAITLHRF